MANGNHVGSGYGGFHSYHSFPQPTPTPSTAAEMSVGLPDLNQPIVANEEDSEFTIREKDRFMPVSNVIRIMRRVLPPHAKISDESKVTIQECVAQFISFLTGKANERCQYEQRKTITAEDMLWSMKKFGFDDYIEPLTLYLQLYRQFDGGERGTLRREPLLLKRPMVDPASGRSIIPYHLPPNYPMAHHYGYFVYPPPMSNDYMQGDESNGSCSRCAVTIVDSDVESPVDEGKE